MGFGCHEPVCIHDFQEENNLGKQVSPFALLAEFTSNDKLACSEASGLGGSGGGSFARGHHGAPAEIVGMNIHGAHLAILYSGQSITRTA